MGGCLTWVPRETKSSSRTEGGGSNPPLLDDKSSIGDTHIFQNWASNSCVSHIRVSHLSHLTSRTCAQHMEILRDSPWVFKRNQSFYRRSSLPQKGFLRLPDSPTFQPLSQIFPILNQRTSVACKRRRSNIQHPPTFHITRITQNSDYEQRPPTRQRFREKQSCF
jgi:hypothetical protein